MTDKPDSTSHKELLKAAETQLVALQEENAALKSDLENMIEAQALETEQMVQMSEQLWKLEEALMSATEEKDAALAMVANLKNSADRIVDYATNALEDVKKNKASRLTMAAQVFEIKSMVDTLSVVRCQ